MMTTPRSILLLILILVSGCGVINPLRGHNINMARDAVRVIEKDLDETYDKAAAQAETPEEEVAVEVERAAAKVAIVDAMRRLNLAQRDFPAPKVKDGEEPVKRSTPEEPSEQDEYLYAAYAGKVAGIEHRREIFENLAKPFTKTWDYIVWIIDALPYILVIAVVVVFGKRLYGLYIFLMRLLPEVVPDKEKRRQIAGGTPVGHAYDREKRKGRYRKEA